MGKAYLQGHGSQHGIPKARQMILEDLANALWKHYELAHANDAQENQNYIADDDDDEPVPDENRDFNRDPGDRNNRGETALPGDFMVSNLVVKSEVQDWEVDPAGDFNQYGD